MPYVNGSFYIQKENQDFWLKIGTPGQTDGVWTRMGNIRDDGASGLLTVNPVLQEGFTMTAAVRRLRFLSAMSLDFGLNMDVAVAPQNQLQRFRFLTPTDAMGFGLSAHVTTNTLLRATMGLGLTQNAAIKLLRKLSASMAYGFNETAALQHTAFISRESVGFNMSAALVRKRLLAASFAYGFTEADPLTRKRSLAPSMAVGFNEAATITLSGAPTVSISATWASNTPSAVNTSFTFTSSGALESHLYDGNLTTDAADPNGLVSTTHAAYDLGSAMTILRATLTTGHTNSGFSSAGVFDIQYSDTSLTAGFTSVGSTITAAAGTDHTANTQFYVGAHRYWRIIYQSGTQGGNAWMAELGFQTNNGPNLGFNMSATLTLKGVLTPTAVNTTFTFTGGGAAQANLYDGSLTTNAADPAGLTTSTSAAYDLGSAKTVTGLNITTGSANGWTSASVFKLQFSDTSLTAGFSDVSGGSFTIQAGLSKTTAVTGLVAGSHRYWRIVYVSGSLGGNAWLAEFDLIGS